MMYKLISICVGIIFVFVSCEQKETIQLRNCGNYGDCFKLGEFTFYTDNQNIVFATNNIDHYTVEFNQSNINLIESVSFADNMHRVYNEIKFDNEKVIEHTATDFDLGEMIKRSIGDSTEKIEVFYFLKEFDTWKKQFYFTLDENLSVSNYIYYEKRQNGFKIISDQPTLDQNNPDVKGIKTFFYDVEQANVKYKRSGRDPHEYLPYSNEILYWSNSLDVLTESNSIVAYTETEFHDGRIYYHLITMNGNFDRRFEANHTKFRKEESIRSNKTRNNKTVFRALINSGAYIEKNGELIRNSKVVFI